MAELLLVRARGLEGFERHFVIKRIREDRESDQGFVDMFLAEARLAAVLHHHNIVQVHDIGEDDGKPYFAMEYVHGEDLRRVLAKLFATHAKMPLAHVIAIVCAAAAALNHAHEAQAPDRTPLGIVHRDVTPANILVGYDGNIKVVDFGIARAAMRRTETQAGMLAGKAPYMAPEQCTGGAIDRRSDVFSLGIVLFELITGRRLFKGENEFLTMSAVVEANVPPPSKHRDGVPAELDAIVLKALARDPAQRYQTAEQMFLALDKLAVIEGLRSSGLSLAGYMRALFGHRMEPWIVDDEDHATMAPVDYDGALPGLAPPPTLGDNPYPMPATSVRASPIAVARETAESEPLAKPVNRIETKSSVRIPDAGGIAKPRTKTGAVPILGPLPARTRPKTVQIPATRALTASPMEDLPTQMEPLLDLLEVPQEEPIRVRARSSSDTIEPRVRARSSSDAIGEDKQIESRPASANVDDGWGAPPPPPAPGVLDAPTARSPGKKTPLPGVKPIPRLTPPPPTAKGSSPLPNLATTTEPKRPTPLPIAAAPALAESSTAQAAKLELPRLAEASSEIAAANVPKMFPVEELDDDEDGSSTFTSVDEGGEPSRSPWDNPQPFEPDEPSVVVRSRSLLMATVREQDFPRAGTDAPTFAERTAIDDQQEEGAALFSADPLVRPLPGMPPVANAYAQQYGKTPPPPAAPSFGGPPPSNQFGVAPALESPYPVYRSTRSDRGSQENITPLPPPPLPGDDAWSVESQHPSQGQPTWLVRVPPEARAALAKKTKMIVGGGVGTLLLIIIIGVATSGDKAPEGAKSTPPAAPIVAAPAPSPPEPIVATPEPIASPPPLPPPPPVTKKAPVKRVAKTASVPKKAIAKPLTRPVAKAALKAKPPAKPAKPVKKVGWDPNALFPSKKK